MYFRSWSVTYGVLDSVCFCTDTLNRVCLSGCLQQNLSTGDLIFLAFCIWLRDPYGGKPIENGFGLKNIVGHFSVFFFC